MTVVVEFRKNKETKNTIRYEAPDGEISGSLYVQKSKVAELGNPEKLKVTIEVVS